MSSNLSAREGNVGRTVCPPKRSTCWISCQRISRIQLLARVSGSLLLWLLGYIVLSFGMAVPVEARPVYLTTEWTGGKSASSRSMEAPGVLSSANSAEQCSTGEGAFVTSNILSTRGGSAARSAANPFLAATSRQSDAKPLTQNSMNPGTRIGVNTASAELFDRSSTGIGPAKAQAIIAYRQAHGKFVHLAELTEVKGIGPATLEKNRDHWCID